MVNHQTCMNYLDPNVLQKIDNLELKARLIVEGYLNGLQKSPYHGFSVEFSQYREYTPGDDIRYIDWKVYGRTDRYYIKQYEEETNLISYFLLDNSTSMQFKNEHSPMSKYDYACHIVASLGYLILQQRDSASLCLFNQDIQKFLAPSTNPSQLDSIIAEMSNIIPKEKTDMAKVFPIIGQTLRKRGLVVVVSDLLDDPAKVVLGLRQLANRKHDVIVLHILDRAEVDMPLQQLTLFEGLEEDTRLLANPRALRAAYLEEVRKFLYEIKRGCVANRIDYAEIISDMPLDVSLTAYLSKRTGKRHL